MSKQLFLILIIAGVLSFAGLTRGQGRGGQRGGDQINLPEGPGKEILQNACTECHSLQMVVGTGYDRQEWGLTLERMITAGANMTPDQIPTLTDYLLKNMAGEGPNWRTASKTKFVCGPVADFWCCWKALWMAAKFCATSCLLLLPVCVHDNLPVYTSVRVLSASAGGFPAQQSRWKIAEVQAFHSGLGCERT